MKERHTYRIKEAARIAGVSVRTMHYYDEIGLLVPRRRTVAGYRLYDADDLLRLQQILIGRELGLSLEQIHQSLDDPCFDRRRALQAQREQLQKRAQETGAMIRAIDAAIALLDNENSRDTMGMKQIFEGFDPAKYEQEVRQRWGTTDAYKESTKRASGYGANEWSRINSEQAAIYGSAVTAMNAGKRPDDSEVMDIAERHRLLIDRWFYPCGLAMHGRLADLLEGDGRYAENIDKYGQGLTTFLVAAMRANAGRGAE